MTVRCLFHIAVVVSASLIPPLSLQAQTAYEATVRGAECRQDDSGSRHCRYRVGKDLEFAIAAVGESDAGISFLRSSIKGDFYARFGIQHGCVIVSAGESAPKNAVPPNGDFAFVSPKSGKVYRTWQDCQKAL